MASKFWRIVIALLLAAAFCGFAGAINRSADDAKPDANAKKTPWKPEDMVFTENAGEFRISPDSKWTVWVKSTTDKEKDGRVSNLYLSSLTEKKEVQLTRGTDNVSHPRWSPNGETIAFLSSHPIPKPKPELAPMQLWLLNTAGGEAWAVTEFERGIHQFEWMDNDTIIFSAEEDPSLFERQAK